MTYLCLAKLRSRLAGLCHHYKGNKRHTAAARPFRRRRALRCIHTLSSPGLLLPRSTPSTTPCCRRHALLVLLPPLDLRLRSAGGPISSMPPRGCLLFSHAGQLTLRTLSGPQLFLCMQGFHTRLAVPPKRKRLPWLCIISRNEVDLPEWRMHALRRQAQCHQHGLFSAPAGDYDKRSCSPTATPMALGGGAGGGN
eukprot:6177885-Pleurochrysis_carterae.AAC.2